MSSMIRVNVFDDPRVARAIEATSRRKLIFAGLSLEVCAAFPAITAVNKGLNAYVASSAPFGRKWLSAAGAGRKTRPATPCSPVEL
jgi:nicotinamidase-related amidase